MQRKIIPDVVSEGQVRALRAGDSAFDAAEAMTEANIGAVVIEDGDGRLIGIVTERDLTRHVVAKARDSRKVPLEDVMTRDPDTLASDDSAIDALQLMHSRSYRHLPVTDNGRCVAMVSIRDLYESVQDALEEDIRETRAFSFGDTFGG